MKKNKNKIIIICILMIAIVVSLFFIPKKENANQESIDDQTNVVEEKTKGDYSFYGYVENDEYVEHLDSFLENQNDIKLHFEDDGSGTITYILGKQETEQQITYDNSNIYFTEIKNSISSSPMIAKYYKDGDFLILEYSDLGSGDKEVYVLSDNQDYLDLIALKEEENSYEKVDNNVFNGDYSESEKSIVVLERAIEYLKNCDDYHELDLDEFIDNYLSGDKSGENLDENGLSYIFVSNNDQSFLKIEVDLATYRISSYSYYLENN